MEPAESLPPRPMQRKRGRAAIHVKIEASKVEKRVNTANNKTKRRPAQLKVSKADSLSPCDEDPPELQLPPPLHPLTESNLRAHTQYTNPGEQPIVMAPTETSRSSATTAIFDKKEALKSYGAHVDSKARLPPELQAHFDDVVNALRSDPPSPAAKNLHRDAELAKLESEAELSSMLNANLMFAGAAADGGEKFIKLTPEANLNLLYVTHPTKKPEYILTQPRPDFMNGYITRDAAAAASKGKFVEPAFSADEEKKLLNDLQWPSIHRRVLCPWVTIEYKAFDSHAAETTSKLQCCRTGIAVTEYMYRLCKRAGPKFKFDTVDTCHWSLSCDGGNVQLYLHWHIEMNGEIQYHMRRVSNDTLEGNWGEEVNDRIVTLRKRLRNILRYTQTERLARIKKALSYIDLLPDLSPRKAKASIVQTAQSSKKQYDEAMGSSVTSSAVANKPNFPPPGSLAQSRPTPLLDRFQQARSSPANGRTSGGAQASRNRTSSQVQQPQVPPSVNSVQQAQREPRRGTRDRKPTKRFETSAEQS